MALETATDLATVNIDVPAPHDDLHDGVDNCGVLPDGPALELGPQDVPGEVEVGLAGGVGANASPLT